MQLSNLFIILAIKLVLSGPCRFISPIYDDLSVKHTDILFLHVDADECEELTDDCEVEAFPTFLFYLNGKRTDDLEGASPELLEEKLLLHAAKLTSL